MKLKFLILITIFFNIKLFAQTTSPFTSVTGIGELNDLGYSNNVAMGGVGISNGSVWHLNNQNPAALTSNIFTTFEMGASSDLREVSNNKITDLNGSANLNYIGFGVPIVKGGKWISSFGFNPFSSVNYILYNEEVLENTSAVARYRYEGEGGLTQAYWSNGIKVSKNLSIGLKGSYIFGNVKNETSVILTNEEKFYTTHYESSTYNDYNLTSGLFYKKELAEEKFLKIGFVYDLKSSLNADRFSRLERRLVNTTNIVPIDTLINHEIQKFSIPKSYGIGFSYEKLDKFSVGIEVKIQSWDNRSGFEDNYDKVAYKNFFKISSGIEFIPDAQNVDKYLKRSTYRFGIFFKKSPYLINNNQINNFGLNLGLSLPVGSLSRINAAVEMGIRGSVDKTFVRERYFKFVLGSSINNIWFIKRKFD